MSPRSLLAKGPPVHPSTKILCLRTTVVVAIYNFLRGQVSRRSVAAIADRTRGSSTRTRRDLAPSIPWCHNIHLQRGNANSPRNTSTLDHRFLHYSSASFWQTHQNARSNTTASSNSDHQGSTGANCPKSACRKKNGQSPV